MPYIVYRTQKGKKREICKLSDEFGMDFDLVRANYIEFQAIVSKTPMRVSNVNKVVDFYLRNLLKTAHKNIPAAFRKAVNIKNILEFSFEFVKCELSSVASYQIPKISSSKELINRPVCSSPATSKFFESRKQPFALNSAKVTPLPQSPVTEQKVARM